MKSVCVYLGSANGTRPSYLAAARATGAALAARGIEVVYGGAAVGCMGALADAAREQGGNVTGILPRVLMEKEIAHKYAYVTAKTEKGGKREDGGRPGWGSG